ncbi:unnamed protein product [Adineta ricciae]|uniref:Carbonic anhydrase n=1 Tax=Adineta ricciae TaxID=249248 RepID=A0A816D5F8_ADIRI|nr:unnamed protein product [Adineta ricciae]CAF1632740.1 unnamed protein product [Adineta ricciae]
MFRIFSFCFVFFFFSFIQLSNLQTVSPSEHEWDYAREGPDTWLHRYESCEGEAQSPINIRTSQVKFDPKLTSPLVFNGYNSNSTVLVWNFTHNGHTIVAYPPPLARLSMSGGGLLGEYYLIQFHFHWGYNAFQGSEHTINEQKFPLEVHFVHRAAFTNSYAVLGILFERQRDDNPYLYELLSILNRTVNSSIAVEHQLNLSRIIPTASSPKFYRYNGSFTTPPCTEGVIWTILKRPVSISEYQLHALLSNAIPFNFRPPQKLYSRKVYTNFQGDDHEGTEEGEGEGHGGHHSSASTCIGQLFLIFISLLVYFFRIQ